jgi:phosphatidylinositol alpha-1,6-mannosyltransferase
MGGIATYTHELADHLGRMGPSVSLLTYPTVGSPPPPVTHHYAIRRFKSFDTRQLIERGGSRAYLISRLPPKILAMARDTTRVLRSLPGGKKRCLLWAITWWPDALAAYLVSRKHGVPYAVTAHGYEAIIPVHARRHFVYKKVLNGASRIFAVSAHTADCLMQCGVSADRLRVIHNGVRPELFELNGGAVRQLEQTRKQFGLEGRFVLLTIARLYPRKGHLTVLKALAGLKDRIPELRYLVVGKGSMKAELEAAVRDLSLDDVVMFTGEVSDQVRTSLLHACDVFVMPNRDIQGPGSVRTTEGFGIVFLEASACAKPVIAGRAGGAPEAVLDGKTGLLVDPEDPAELMEAISKLRSDRHLAGRLGAAGKERVRREFTWKGLSMKYLQEFSAVLSPAKSGGAP